MPVTALTVFLCFGSKRFLLSIAHRTDAQRFVEERCYYIGHFVHCFN